MPSKLFEHRLTVSGDAATVKRFADDIDGVSVRGGGKMVAAITATGAAVVSWRQPQDAYVLDAIEEVSSFWPTLDFVFGLDSGVGFVDDLAHWKNGELDGNDL